MYIGQHVRVLLSNQNGQIVDLVRTKWHGTNYVIYKVSTMNDIEYCSIHDLALL